MTKKFLIVRLDQYAGNVDEIVCVALTGWGAHRYGESQARKVFDTKVKQLLEDRDDEYPDLPVEFCQFETEYGLMPYSLDEYYTNNLKLAIDNYTEQEQLQEMIELWKRAYGDENGNISISVSGIHDSDVTVNVLGFDLVEYTQTRRILD